MGGLLRKSLLTFLSLSLYSINIYGIQSSSSLGAQNFPVAQKHVDLFG